MNLKSIPRYCATAEDAHRQAFLPDLADARVVKLLALDLDGTLLEPGEKILPSVVEALLKVAGKGVIVATASGRSLEDQLRILAGNGLGAEAGLPHYLIVNEQEIYELRGCMYQPWEEHNRIVRERWLSVLPRALQVAATEVEYLRGRGVAVELWPPDVAAQRGMVVLKFERVEDARLCEARLRQLLAGDSELQCDRSYRLIQILHKSAGKGPTLLTLLKALGLPEGAALCIGDAPNDLSMLDGSYGFMVAAVGNAEEEVKEAVRRAGGYVASRPRGEGVLEVLRAYNLV
ncbi:MAG: HAD family hydrolase [Thermofilaceae archaeon]